MERAQFLFREVNDRIRQIVAGDYPEFLCECANLGCTETVYIRVADYERVREFPRRFIVRPGHGLEERERIVEDGDGFVVVEAFGALAPVANAVNPGRRTGPTLS